MTAKQSIIIIVMFTSEAAHNYTYECLLLHDLRRKEAEQCLIRRQLGLR